MKRVQWIHISRSLIRKYEKLILTHLAERKRRKAVPAGLQEGDGEADEPMERAEPVEGKVIPP